MTSNNGHSSVLHVVSSSWASWRGWDSAETDQLSKVRSNILRSECGPGVFDSDEQCGGVLACLCASVQFDEAYISFVQRWAVYVPKVLCMFFGSHGSLLCHAVLGTKEMVVALLDVNADPNMSHESFGSCVLFMAVQRNRWDVVRVLLERGADPNKCNSQGVSILGYVAGRFGRRYHDVWYLRPSQTAHLIYNDADDVDHICLLIRYGANLEQIEPHSLLSVRPISPIDILRGPRIFSYLLLAWSLDDIFEAWQDGPHPSQVLRRCNMSAEGDVSDVEEA